MADDDRGSGGRNGGVRRLVIVESPTRAHARSPVTIRLHYIVESSRGHIRDLPRAAADVPAKYKWRALGAPRGQRGRGLRGAPTSSAPIRSPTVTRTQGPARDVDELYLATDGDREGEAIAWHLLETLKPRMPVKRMVFHEITEARHPRGGREPRDLDINLVDAGDAPHPRPAVRLRGLPVLWKKVARKLSAGRVQSVATRIIVQRERGGWRSAAPATGISRRAGRQCLRPDRSPAQCSPHGWSPSTAAAWPPAGLRFARRADQADEVLVARPRPAPVNWSPVCAERVADRRLGGGEAVHARSRTRRS